MKKILTAILIFWGTAALAQDTAAGKPAKEFRPLDYFYGDSVSFYFESCVINKEKKKEEQSCRSEKTTCRLKNTFDFVVYTEQLQWVEGRTPTSHTVTADIRKIDLYKTTLRPETFNNKDNVPITFYWLTFRARSGEENPFWYESANSPFPPSFQGSVSIPFAKAEDAEAAKKYLRSFFK